MGRRVSRARAPGVRRDGKIRHNGNCSDSRREQGCRADDVKPCRTATRRAIRGAHRPRSVHWAVSRVGLASQAGPRANVSGRAPRIIVVGRTDHVGRLSMPFAGGFAIMSEGARRRFAARRSSDDSFDNSPVFPKFLWFRPCDRDILEVSGPHCAAALPSTDSSFPLCQATAGAATSTLP
jgi:hypothetical protein